MALRVAEGRTARMSLSVKSLGAAGKDSYLLTKSFSPYFYCHKQLETEVNCTCYVQVKKCLTRVYSP